MQITKSISSTYGHYMIGMVAAILSALSNTPSFAQSNSNSEGTFGYRASLHSAMNPGAIGLQGDFTYQHPLYYSNSPLFAQNKFEIQLGMGISPASLGPSLRIALQPLSILQLWFGYQGNESFGARSFSSPSADFGRGAFSRLPAPRPNETDEYKLWINRFEFGIRPQLQIGNFFARSSWRLEGFNAKLRGDDRVFYEPSVNNLVYSHGWAIRSDSDFGYAIGQQGANGILVGARLSTTFVFYPDSAFGPGEPGKSQDNSNSPSTRIGPLLRIPLLNPDKARKVDQLFVTGIAQFYISDRFHTGLSTPKLLPNISLTLTALGDL